MSHFLLTLALTHLAFGQATPDRVQQGPRELSVPELQSIHRQHLEWHRSRRVLFEEHIEWLESIAREDSELYGLWSPRDVRERAAKVRLRVESMKKYEQELERWDQHWKRNPEWRPDAEAYAKLRALVPVPDAATVARVDKALNEWRNQSRGVNLAPPPREKK
jgi:hypothetical protein